MKMNYLLFRTLLIRFCIERIFRIAFTEFEHLFLLVKMAIYLPVSNHMAHHSNHPLAILQNIQMDQTPRSKVFFAVFLKACSACREHPILDLLELWGSRQRLCQILESQVNYYTNSLQSRKSILQSF